VDPYLDLSGFFGWDRAVNDGAMKTERFRCRCCKRLKWKRTKDQCYCGDRACQKARKNAWRREKYATDADYRANQRESTRAWLAGRGGGGTYYRAYRESQRKQSECVPKASGNLAGNSLEGESPSCDAERATGANSDAKAAHSAVKSGVYVMSLVPESRRANSDAFLVKISLIPTSYVRFANIDSMGNHDVDR